LKLFSHLFGKKKINTLTSEYLPKESDINEIQFAKKFTKKGGKFIYCESKIDTLNYYNQILDENGWEDTDILCEDPLLKGFFNLKDSSSEKNLKKVQVLSCEFLIANKGSILICSKQINNKKLNQIPENLILLSSTNQFVSDVSEAMTNINGKYNEDLPTNISTINTFNSHVEKDFLTYGSTSKNLYLLVQEQY
tara:strand:+ start:10 stop:591 length:582 start_codon:yes stop_codon:yes gene_type:complete